MPDKFFVDLWQPWPVHRGKQKQNSAHATRKTQTQIQVRKSSIFSSIDKQCEQIATLIKM